MTDRRPLWDWSLDFVGDPASWQARGELIAEFLREEGLQPNDKVLDLGCGNLSEGVPLIHALAPGCFFGLEPNGWLVEAALDRFPDLEHKQPRFRWDTDFGAERFEVTFDYVVAHSVLSHVAHWQMSQAMRAIRATVAEGAVWLASLRLDQYNSYSQDWVYPGVSTFRLQTVMALGYQAGWNVKIRTDLRDRLVTVAPNDLHDWIELLAIATPEQGNDQRLKEEQLERDHRETARVEKEERRADMDERDRDLIKASGIQ